MRGRLHTAIALAVSLAASVAGIARAQDDPAKRGDASAVTEEPSFGVLPALAAIFPGAVLHGTGHLVAGDGETAYELMLAEGVGIGLAGFGVLGVAASGGGDLAFGPLYSFWSLAWIGGGIFALSWLADIYGAATGGEGLGTPSPPPRDVEVELGYRYMYDPQFDLEHLAVAEASFNPDRFRITPSAWIGLDDRNERWRLEAAVRAIGARVGPTEQDDPDSFLEIELAGTWHDWHDVGFAYLLAEISSHGRYDLSMLSPTLRGMFVEGELGYAVQAFDYDAPDQDLGTDVVGMLLFRTAVGLYLGHDRVQRGEVALYYDHRRESFVGGLGRPVYWGSVLGHFGVDASFWLDEHWGVRADARLGSAFLGGASAMYRWED